MKRSIASKLADRIRRASRVEPAPMGFAAAAALAVRPTMLCLVRLSANEANKISEAAAKGADAVVIDGTDPGKLKDQISKAGELPVGVRATASRPNVASCRQAGVDFVVLEPDAMAESLLEENIGVVMALSSAPDDTSLRLLGELGLDALMVPAPPAPVTVEGLLSLRRMASLARTPLLTEVAADIDASQLHVLRESGVLGVIIGAPSLGKLESLRQRIAALPVRGRPREEHAEALIPAQAMAGADHEDEYEDDE